MGLKVSKWRTNNMSDILLAQASRDRTQVEVYMLHSEACGVAVPISRYEVRPVNSSTFGRSTRWRLIMDWDIKFYDTLEEAVEYIRHANPDCISTKCQMIVLDLI